MFFCLAASAKAPMPEKNYTAEIVFIYAIVTDDAGDGQQCRRRLPGLT